MDEKQRQLDVEKTERQLEKTTARLKMLDATAREHEADGAIAEVTGLQALHDRIGRQVREWKNADLASVAELRDQVQRGVDALSRGADAAGDRLDRFSDATDRWIDAETDQVGAACQIFYAWLGEEWVGDKQAGKDLTDDLRVSWDEVQKKHQELKKAAPEKKNQARRELEASLNRIKSKLQNAAIKLKSQHKAPAEQRT